MSTTTTLPSASRALLPDGHHGEGARKANYFALLVGPPGHGKTSLAVMLARDRLAAGRWLLVHDPDHEFRGLAAWYETTDDFRRELARAADEQLPLTAGAAFPCEGGADELLELAIELGSKWNRSGAGPMHPICLVVNEASAFDQAGSTFLGKLQNVALNQRRHLGLELIYLLTRPSMLPRSVYDVATDAFLFFQSSSERVRTLETLLGLERDALDLLLRLPPHNYVHWQPRRADGVGGLV